MKKAIALILLLAMSLLSVSSASASWINPAEGGAAEAAPASALSAASENEGTVKFSASILGTDELKRFSSFTEADGVYSVRSYAADTALRSLASGSSNGCFFTVEICGAEELGIAEPVLTAYYRASQATNASAIVIAADGKRFTFSAKSEMKLVGRRYLEVAKAPLTAEGLAFLASLESADNVSLRLCGDRVYTTEIKKSAQSGIALIEAQSLSASKAVLDFLSPLLGGDYTLWNLSAGWWEAGNGFAPAFEAADVAQADDYKVSYDEIGMLASGDSSSSVKAVQTMLISSGFMYGTASQSFNEETRTAVISAQKYFGLIETGCVTPELVACLNGNAPAKETKTASETEMLSFDGKVGIAIKRAWFAKGIAPRKGDASQAIKPANGDNLFIVAAGSLLGTVSPALRLYRDLTAYFVCGAYRYEASLVCEADEGKAFITEALPLSESRLVIYAELPSPAASLTGWKLVVTFGDIEKTWTLGN